MFELYKYYHENNITCNSIITKQKKMASIFFTIGLVKSVTKTNETITGEAVFRLNEIEFGCLEFKIFNRSPEHQFHDIIKSCIYSFVGSFFFDSKIKVGFLPQMINDNISMN